MTQVSCYLIVFWSKIISIKFFVGATHAHLQVCLPICPYPHLPLLLGSSPRRFLKTTYPFHPECKQDEGRGFYLLYLLFP